MENNYFNQRIACHVSHCKYYDKKEEKCSLGTIRVGTDKAKKTYCETYEAKNELK